MYGLPETRKFNRNKEYKIQEEIKMEQNHMEMPKIAMGAWHGETIVCGKKR